MDGLSLFFISEACFSTFFIVAVPINCKDFKCFSYIHCITIFFVLFPHLTALIAHV